VRSAALAAALAITGAAALAAFAYFGPSAGAAAPTLEAFRCSGEVKEHEFECFMVTVPENRRHPTGTEVRLAVAVKRSADPKGSDDPLISIPGGPGYPGLGDLPPYLLELAETHDIVLIDPRGTGLSTPSLDCPEADGNAKAFAALAAGGPEATELMNGALTECRARLVEEGVDLNAYASVDIAADLDDVRRALGYDEWTLIGTSYGTRTALTMARDRPDGIRAMVLDSSVPLERDLPATENDDLADALEEAFERCAIESPTCFDFEETWRETLARLEREPETITSVSTAAGSVEVALDGDEFIALTRGLLSRGDYLWFLPQLTRDVADRADPDTVAQLALEVLPVSLIGSEGAMLSAMCREEKPFSDPDEIAASRARTEERIGLAPAIDVTTYGCEVWDVEPADAIESEPVQSAIPTLVLAGQFDPLTAPEAGRMVADSLPNSTFVLIPSDAHGVLWLRDTCATKILADFLDDLEPPDRSCTVRVGSIPWAEPGS
jgi:pimeloyl-ACP methyl ester carboxylesterase